MILITHLYDICSTQAHIPVMLASVGLFLFGVTIICIEVRKMEKSKRA